MRQGRPGLRTVSICKRHRRPHEQGTRRRGPAAGGAPVRARTLRPTATVSLSMPSLCMAAHARDFLRRGTLPAEGPECEIDVPYLRNNGGIRKRDVADESVLEAQGVIAEKMRRVRP
ncbi:hypothetical protein J3459_019224 [Metarhizium acridum]|nr:hypothetical protein J3459_019224 [Metarhizium acridum]